MREVRCQFRQLIKRWRLVAGGAEKSAVHTSGRIILMVDMQDQKSKYLPPEVNTFSVWYVCAW